MTADRDRAFLAKHRQLGRADAVRSPSLPRASAEPVSIAGEIVDRHPAGRAVKFYDGARSEWVPLSQLTDNKDGTWSMPEWLAKEKGFI